MILDLRGLDTARLVELLEFKARDRERDAVIYRQRVASSAFHVSVAESDAALLRAVVERINAPTPTPETPLCDKRFPMVTAPHKISQGIVQQPCEMPMGHDGDCGLVREESAECSVVERVQTGAPTTPDVDTLEMCVREGFWAATSINCASATLGELREKADAIAKEYVSRNRHILLPPVSSALESQR